MGQHAACDAAGGSLAAAGEAVPRIEALGMGIGRDLEPLRTALGRLAVEMVQERASDAAAKRLRCHVKEINLGAPLLEPEQVEAEHVLAVARDGRRSVADILGRDGEFGAAAREERRVIAPDRLGAEREC